MGPRSIDRGITAAERRRAKRAELQWGRDQLIAEFGGMATGNSTFSPLQWGRDQLIAEFVVS